MLLKLDGPLSVMPMSFRKSANESYLNYFMLTEDDEIDNCEWRGTHQHFTNKEKLKLNKRSAELGITCTSLNCYFTPRPGEERMLSPSILLIGKRA